MMVDDKKNGRVSLAAVLTVLGIIGGPLAVWGDAQIERGAMKEKVATVEQRQAEDRHATKEAINKIDTKVERIDQNVNSILLKLNTLETLQRQQRR